MNASFFSRGSDPVQEGSAEDASSLRPAPPLAKRLNRNALTVAAVIMGMTVLTAIVVLNPGKNEGKADVRKSGMAEEPPVASRPTFLDEPVRDNPASDVTLFPGTVPTPDGQQHFPLSDGRQELTPGSATTARAQWPEAVTDPYNPYSPSPSTAASSGGESSREKAFQAALTSRVMVGTPQVEPTTDIAQGIGSLSAEEEQLLSLGDSILRSAVRQAPASPDVSGSGAQAPDRAPGPGSGSRGGAFLNSVGYSADATVTAVIENAGSPYTLRAGSVIPGNLITGINSDLPGEIVAQVSRDVYDSRTQRIVLVPRGSRLIGTYDNQVAAGQGRLLIAWTRLRGCD